MQKWIVAEAEALQSDAKAHLSVAVLVKYGLPLTRKNYLNLQNLVHLIPYMLAAIVESLRACRTNAT